MLIIVAEGDDVKVKVNLRTFYMGVIGFVLLFVLAMKLHDRDFERQRDHDARVQISTMEMVMAVNEKYLTPDQVDHWQQFVDKVRAGNDVPREPKLNDASVQETASNQMGAVIPTTLKWYKDDQTITSVVRIRSVNSNGYEFIRPVLIHYLKAPNGIMRFAKDGGQLITDQGCSVSLPEDYAATMFSTFSGG
ncbi:MAG: hypothetical protein Q7S15_02755 [bacterium]|nr:hypothetical protein [bacterium]